MSLYIFKMKNHHHHHAVAILATVLLLLLEESKLYTEAFSSITPTAFTNRHHHKSTTTFLQQQQDSAILKDQQDETSPLLDDNNDDDDNKKSSAATLRAVTFQSLTSSTPPQLLSDFLMELGACSVSITDHDRDTPNESPIFREPGDTVYQQEDSAEEQQQEEQWATLTCGDQAVGKNVWKRCDVTAHIPSSLNLLQITESIRVAFELEQMPRYTVDDVPDLDWVRHVQSSWKPIVHEGFVLRFPWHTEQDVEEAVGKGRKEEVGGEEWVEIELGGGIAFGTGEHPTTRHCLRWIKETIPTLLEKKGEEEIKFLDYGAGSGVLGLAACALSSSSSSSKIRNIQAIGVEIDIDAVSIANENAAANNLPMKSYLPRPSSSSASSSSNNDAETSSLLMKALARASEHSTDEKFPQPLPKELDGPIYDACASNILAGPLIGLCETIAGMVKPGGQIGLSGVLADQADRVVEVYGEYFEGVRVDGEEGGWVLITGTRKQ